MKQVLIDKNDSGQRIDRFLKKYFPKAPNSFIYKMLRKKNIKINGKKAKPDTEIFHGDIIDLYLSDETIEKFRGAHQVPKSNVTPRIIYEDKNIILVNKEVGTLSHSADKESYNNIADSIIYYLYEKGEYNPQLENTFTPAICNRLDRNTSGIIIAAKNYQALKALNLATRKGNIGKFYKTIVKGRVKDEGILEGFLTKNEELNKVRVVDKEDDHSKKIVTKIKVLDTSKEYSLLEIELITGRTHQIRAHLASIDHPIIGDIKYGNRNVNKYFKSNHGLESQFLHAYKIEFTKLTSPLDYLNGRIFTARPESNFLKIEEELFS